MSLINSVKPPGITCPKWVPEKEGSKRCAAYRDGGSCSLEGGAPDGAPTCIEWRKKKNAQSSSDEKQSSAGASVQASAAQPSAVGGSEASREGAVQKAPSSGEAPFALAAPAPKPMSPERAALLERAAQTIAARPSLTRVPLLGGGHATIVNPEPFAPAKEIPPDSIEALEKYGLELELGGGELKTPIVLVPKLTKRAAERIELTYRDAATLRLLVDAFPGARVVDVKRIGGDDHE